VQPAVGVGSACAPTAAAGPSMAIVPPGKPGKMSKLASGAGLASSSSGDKGAPIAPKPSGFLGAKHAKSAGVASVLSVAPGPAAIAPTSQACDVVAQTLGLAVQPGVGVDHAQLDPAQFAVGHGVALAAPAGAPSTPASAQCPTGLGQKRPHEVMLDASHPDADSGNDDWTPGNFGKVTNRWEMCRLCRSPRAADSQRGCLCPFCENEMRREYREGRVSSRSLTTLRDATFRRKIRQQSVAARAEKQPVATAQDRQSRKAQLMRELKQLFQAELAAP